MNFLSNINSENISVIPLISAAKIGTIIQIEHEGNPLICMWAEYVNGTNVLLPLAGDSVGQVFSGASGVLSQPAIDVTDLVDIIVVDAVPLRLGFQSIRLGVLFHATASNNKPTVCMNVGIPASAMNQQRLFGYVALTGSTRGVIADMRDLVCLGQIEVAEKPALTRSSPGP